MLAQPPMKPQCCATHLPRKCPNHGAGRSAGQQDTCFMGPKKISMKKANILAEVLCMKLASIALSTPFSSSPWGGACGNSPRSRDVKQGARASRFSQPSNKEVSLHRGCKQSCGRGGDRAVAQTPTHTEQLQPARTAANIKQCVTTDQLNPHYSINESTSATQSSKTNSLCKLAAYSYILPILHFPLLSPNSPAELLGFENELLLIRYRAGCNSAAICNSAATPSQPQVAKIQQKHF